ncbi:immunoglobulin-like domain-containing protein [Paenibacillus sp. Z6-24]
MQNAKKLISFCLAASLVLPGASLSTAYADGESTDTGSVSSGSSVTGDTYASPDSAAAAPVVQYGGSGYSVATSVYATKPIITLTGDPQITLTAGQAYVESGATVQDDTYPDLKAANVTYTLNNMDVNSVDTSTPGIYTAHYNVTNPAGQSADEVQRTIEIKQALPAYVDLSKLGITAAYGVAYHDGYVYVAQRYKALIRVSVTTGEVTTIADAFKAFMAVAVDSEGNLYYSIDSDPRIYKLNSSYLSSLPMTESELASRSTVYYTHPGPTYIYGLVVDGSGNLYYSDYTNKAIIKVPPVTKQPVTVITNFPTSLRAFTFDNEGNFYAGGNDSRIYRASAQNFGSAPLAPNAIVNITPNNYYSAYGLVFLPDGQAYMGTAGSIVKISLQAAKPVITLKGNATVQVEADDVYTDPGVTIADPSSSSPLLPKVTYTFNGSTVSGVNTSVPGTYIVHYNVTNSSGTAAAEVTRTVIVKPAPTKLTEVKVDRPFGLTYYNNDVYYADYSLGIYKISGTTFKKHLIAADQNMISLTFNSSGDLFYSKTGSANVYKVLAANLQGDLPLTAQQLANYSEVYYTADGQVGVTGMTFDNQGRLYLSLQYSSHLNSKIVRFNDNLATAPQLVAEYPVAMYGIAFGPYGNLYVNAGNFHTYKIGAPQLRKLPVTSSSFQDIGTNNGGYGLVILPDNNGYLSHVQPNTPLSRASFTDQMEAVPVDSVSLDTQTLSLKKRGTTQTLTATVLPADASNPAVLWTTSDPSVATVANGVVTPLNKGTAIITVTTVDGSYSSSAIVTVRDTARGSSNSTSETISLSTGTGTSSTTGSSSVSNAVTGVRTIQPDGKKTDMITLSSSGLNQAVARLTSGETTARLSVPDLLNEVASTSITLPVSASQSLKRTGTDLEIMTNNVSVTIPVSVLNSINNDLHFNLTPVKDGALLQPLRNTVASLTPSQAGTILGNPVTVESNLQNQLVQLTLPVSSKLLSQNAEAQAKWLQQLRIFSKYADGSSELIQPKVVKDASGNVGLQFASGQLSTVAVVDQGSASN